MKRRYHYPAHLPSSALVMLVAHKAGHNLGRMSDLSDILTRVAAGQIDIDTRPASLLACTPRMYGRR
jgi:hypothetical protein